MIDNLKLLVALMDCKQDFVLQVSLYFGTSFAATMKNWFQGNWNLPKDKLPKVIEIAQNYLYQQNLRERQALKDTGFKFEKQTA